MLKYISNFDRNLNKTRMLPAQTLGTLSTTFSEIPRTWSFHVVVLQRTTKNVVLLIKPFDLWRSRCRCRRGLLKVPN